MKCRHFENVFYDISFEKRKETCNFTNGDNDLYTVFPICSGFFHFFYQNTSFWKLKNFKGNHKFRFKTEENNILYLNTKHSLSFLTGYLQSHYNFNWKTVPLLSKRNQELICKSFGFLHHHYTGNYEKIEIISPVSTIHCQPYVKNINDCKLVSGILY